MSRISPGVNDCSHILVGTVRLNGRKSIVQHSVVDHRLDSTTPNEMSNVGRSRSAVKLQSAGDGVHVDVRI